MILLLLLNLCFAQDVVNAPYIKPGTIVDVSYSGTVQVYTEYLYNTVYSKGKECSEWNIPKEALKAKTYCPYYVSKGNKIIAHKCCWRNRKGKDKNIEEYYKLKVILQWDLNANLDSIYLYDEN